MYQRRRDVNLTRLDTCDRLVAPSQRVADIYASLGVRTDRMVVQRLTLPHLATIAAPPARSPGTPLVFATLGGCASRSKGSGVLIEAVQALERSGHGGSYRLLVLGGVDEHTRQAFANVESVSLLGPYAPQDLDALLEPADVGLMPSVWEEVHGFVGIEMLAKGLPLIGNALGGIPEYVVEGETGWLNRSATGAELAELMARLLADRADVERLRESVRARRATIVRPMAEHAAEVEAMYADVVGATAPAPPAAG
jgi:glycosyltransferase involved in cell wall biosynthesis